MAIFNKKQAHCQLSSGNDKTLWWSRLWEEMHENMESWYDEVWKSNGEATMKSARPDLRRYQKNVERINDVSSGDMCITNLPRRCGYSTSVLLLALEFIANSDQGVDVVILTKTQKSAQTLKNRLFHLEQYMSDFVFDAGLFIVPSTQQKIVFVESHKTGHRSKITFTSEIFTGARPDVIMVDH